MKKIIVLVLAALLLTGCESTKEQQEKEQLAQTKDVKVEEGLTVEVSEKPIDVLVKDGKLFVLSAGMNSVDIFNHTFSIFFIKFFNLFFCKFF